MKFWKLGGLKVYSRYITVVKSFYLDYLRQYLYLKWLGRFKFKGKASESKILLIRCDFQSCFLKDV